MDGDHRSVEARAHYIEEVCGDMSQEIRGVVFELRDEQFGESEDLKQQIQTIVEKWRNGTGIKTTFTTQGVLPRLPFKTSHDVRQIISEALSNIRQHAGASNVQISLMSTERDLTIQIKDDGHGFDWAGDPSTYLQIGRLGLVSMKERVEGLVGNFEIKTGPDGTMIIIDIPLDRAGR